MRQTDEYILYILYIEYIEIATSVTICYESAAHWEFVSRKLVRACEEHYKTNGRMRYVIRGRYDHSTTGTD